MKKITIENTFHNNSVNVKMREGQECLTESQINRVRRSLCSIKECKCFSYSFIKIEGHDWNWEYDGCETMKIWEV